MSGPIIQRNQFGTYYGMHTIRLLVAIVSALAVDTRAIQRGYQAQTEHYIQYC